jgi:hypothetical protein
MAEIPCVSVVIMQSKTVKTRAENSELLLKSFTIPGKSVAMPADSDRPLQAAIVHPADDLKVSFDPGLVETLLDEVESKPGSLPLLQLHSGRCGGGRRTGRSRSRATSTSASFALRAYVNLTAVH